MQRLASASELLDGPLDDSLTLRDILRDLGRANLLTGGVALSRRAIEALSAGTREVTLLDVGTGGADIPVALLAEAKRRGRRLRVTAVDRREEVLAAARGRRPRLDRITGLARRGRGDRGCPVRARGRWRVSVTGDGRTASQIVLAGGSYLAGPPREAYFGLSASAVADLVRIDWANGQTTELRSVRANQILRVARP